MTIKGNIIDLHQNRIYYGEVSTENGIIKEVREREGTSRNYLLPGFVDAHVHIESSMLVPSEFARMAVVHGTVATVSDPHEIANVLGMEGVRFMIENGKQTPFKFFFGAPSCVPATSFETAGACLDVGEVTELLQWPDIWYLSEMMNYPGVLFKDEKVMAKIEAAHRSGKRVDGHAPGLRGEEAKAYFSAGITTDHECFTYQEGWEKAKLGVHILIREGSAARNFDALIPLLDMYPRQIMFCSDDKHPDDLVKSHINRIVARALHHGCDLFDVLRAACLNPVKHYKLPVGLLRAGDPADFILTDDLEEFAIQQTWVAGQLVAENGKTLIPSIKCRPINHFDTSLKMPADFSVPVPVAASSEVQIRVIKALDGQIVTESMETTALVSDGVVISDTEKDILKFTVVNRYASEMPAVAFIQNFSLCCGAIASCVGHDSHNILAVGVDDHSLCRAVNLVIENKGGISAVDGKGTEMSLPLPVAGIMSADDGWEIAQEYSAIDSFVKQVLGCKLSAPFMTLSFMALLVIPQLKLSDKGLFDGKGFRFVGLFV